MAPETPQIRLRTLFFRRRGDGYALILTRIERAGDASNRAALTGGIGAFEQDGNRQALELRLARQHVESALPFFELGLIFVFRQALGEVERAEPVTGRDPRG